MIPYIKEKFDKCKVALTPGNIYIFFIRFNHLFLVIALLALYPQVGRVSRWIDPSAVPLDAGTFSMLYQALIFAAVVLAFATVGHWLNHRASFYSIDDDEKAKELLKQTSPEFKLIYGWLVFSTYLLVSLVCLSAVTHIASAAK